jgi:transposase IS116/IS110/IS902 family protein
MRLMSIPAVGPITALTWVLELSDAKRFPCITEVISYCGLCGSEKSSARTAKRTPISKQRNRHLQTVLVEAPHLAPRLNRDLALLYEKEAQKGNRNRATLAVARKLTADLLAIERGERPFSWLPYGQCLGPSSLSAVALRRSEWLLTPRRVPFRAAAFVSLHECRVYEIEIAASHPTPKALGNTRLRLRPSFSPEP